MNGICIEETIYNAMEFFAQFDWFRNEPDLVSFNTILSAACKQRNHNMIRRILFQMEYNGYRLDVVSYTCLVHYYYSTGNIPKCLEILKSMINDRLTPSLPTINILISALCRNGLLGEAQKVFKHLVTSGVSPDISTYNILIWATIQEGKNLLVHQLERDIYDQNLNPDLLTYQLLIFVHCEEGKISLALQLRDQMLHNGIPPTICIYNMIIEAMSKQSKFRELMQLLEEMEKEGCELNADSFKILNRSVKDSQMKGFPRTAKLLRLVMDKSYVKSNITEGTS